MRRSSDDIKAGILTLALESTSRCEIFYKCHIPYPYHSKYLTDLNDKGLLKEEKQKGKIIFKTTDKGRRWLNAYQQLRAIEKE